MISVDMINLSKMTRSERESVQKRIVQFYVNIAGKKKNVTVNHFLKEKIPRQTIYSIIKNMKNLVTLVTNQDLAGQEKSVKDS